MYARVSSGFGVTREVVSGPKEPRFTPFAGWTDFLCGSNLHINNRKLFFFFFCSRFTIQEVTSHWPRSIWQNELTTTHDEEARLWCVAHEVVAAGSNRPAVFLSVTHVSYLQWASRSFGVAEIASGLCQIVDLSTRDLVTISMMNGFFYEALTPL